MKKRGNMWAVILFVLWTAFIFARSMQPAGLSNEESEKVLSILEQLPSSGVSNHVVRKAAHVIEYAVLGCLGWFAFDWHEKRRWERALFAQMACFFVALCDETIQLFVEGRGGKVSDVWLDAAGALGGVVVSVCVQRLYQRVKKK